MTTQEHVVTTQSGSGDITPAPDGSAHLQEVSNTAEAAGVVERAKPDEAPAAPGSDEIYVEEIFNFDIGELDPEDNTDGPAFHRAHGCMIFSASSDGQTSIHRFGTACLVLTAKETRELAGFLADTSSLWGEKCQ